MEENKTKELINVFSNTYELIRQAAHPFLGQDMLSIHLPLDKTVQICEAQKGLGIIRLRQSCLVEQSPM